MRFACFALLFAALAVAPASAGPAERNSSARVVTCEVEGQSATFRGRIERFGGAQELQMRFVLQSRTVSSPAWSRVEGVWGELITRPGAFEYDRTIEELVVGADYRAVVRFRWRGTKGKVLARATRATRPCRQPDTRPDLLAERISVGPGPSAETRVYTVRVLNSGESEAAPFLTRLQVEGSDLGVDDTALALAPGESTTLEFTGSPCAAGSPMIATVDVDDEVDEADEADNALTEPCPAAAAARPRMDL